MNVQVTITGDLKIIDDATGFVGVATIPVALTRFVLHRYSCLLDEREWCWVDAGYPTQSWLIISKARSSNVPAILSSSRDSRQFE